MSKNRGYATEYPLIRVYGEDIAVLASNPEELQLMLDTIYVWLRNLPLALNEKKSKLVHFRVESKC